MTFPTSGGATQTIVGTEQSLAYPAKVFFWTPAPELLLAGGATHLAVEAFIDGVWEEVTDDDTRIALEAEVYNYAYVDPNGEAGDLYRAVLVGGVGFVPVPQPPIKAIDTAYEAIMTTTELRDIYLWGQDTAFINEAGIYQPEYTFVHNILFGIDKVESILNISLLPRKFVEKHDLDVTERNGAGYPVLRLDNYPVLAVERVTRQLPGQSSPTVYDPAALQVDAKLGDLMLLDVQPNSPTAFGLARGAVGRIVPMAYEVTYFAGFDPTRRSPYGGRGIPPALKEAVGKEAAFGPLNVGGDLVGGAGLAGSSISMDGLSQSITTTNSSTNAGFGARLIQYEKELKNAYKFLRKYYKRINFQVA